MLFAVAVDVALLHAQITVSVNPANMQDARVLLTNPAAASMPEARAYLGLKLIYPGAVPQNTFALKASYFNISVPRLGRYDFAAGLHGRYFNTPLFQEGRFGAIVARQFTERVFIGVDLALLFESYNKENFDLVDANDPVFRRGTSAAAFDLGIGVLAKLHEKLTLATSVSHLTQPDVALGGAPFKLPFESLLGLRFVQNFLRFDVGAHLWREQIYPIGGAEIFSSRSDRLRLGYGLNNFLFEGKILLRGNASFFYCFNLPTNDLGLLSAGSHEVGFIYAFGAQPRSRLEREAHDFTLHSDADLQTIEFNEPVVYRISLAPRGQMTSRIRLGIRDLPANIAAEFVPSEIGPHEISRLTLRPQPNLVPGEYVIHVEGRPLARTETTRLLPLRLRVKAKPRLLAAVRATVDTVLFTELREVQEELPIIPRIFFPRNSAELAPTRYDLLTPRQQSMFSSDVREINAAYRNLLNIIADRLRANPAMQVTLKGYSSGATIENDPGELSRQRAEKVRDYLVRSAGVNPHQVRAEAGEIDAREAGARDPLRLEELQRVDIEVRSEDEEKLLAPITFEKKEIDAMPKRCGFLTHASFAEAGLENWRLFLLADRDTVGVLAGKQTLPDTIWWDWQFGPAWSNRQTKFWQEVRYSLWLQDRAGQVSATPWQNIRSRRVQQESIHIERIPIILFAFDEYELDRTSRRLQTKLRQIADKLRSDPAAVAQLYGHTDAIGTPEHNKQLSIQRAQHVSAELVKMGISSARLFAYGFSETQPLADNRLPEGRMMNRRVEVHIRHSSDLTNKSRR
ncbi:MAG: OmpA family protein [candidate division KSB1 bacterium]|nr:OmpA family protein [candidate division KSB1 bacterium]